MTINKYLFNHLDMISLSVHDRITSLRGEACVHKTSLIPPPYIEVPVRRPERELSCICVLGQSILPLSAILIFDFGIFRQGGIFWFSFYKSLSMY